MTQGCGPADQAGSRWRHRLVPPWLRGAVRAWACPPVGPLLGLGLSDSVTLVASHDYGFLCSWTSFLTADPVCPLPKHSVLVFLAGHPPSCRMVACGSWAGAAKCCRGECRQRRGRQQVGPTEPGAKPSQPRCALAQGVLSAVSSEPVLQRGAPGGRLPVAGAAHLGRDWLGALGAGNPPDTHGPARLWAELSPTKLCAEAFAG